ncbi:DUF4123 domain-containing protein [Pseudomonas sp. R1-15]|uniref:DUF4123 domain-containing protein n=1 Tax=Pseudomonas sp. R1-15 TaxID=2817399 RepID=UPI003DA7C386
MAPSAFTPLDPRTWLAQQPLQENEHLYLIISAASEAGALQALRTSVLAHPLLPIWSDTPYAAWQAVMPYVTKLEPDSAFLTWIAGNDALDWGWLAVSHCEPGEVLTHLRSLTQVRMPDGNPVFFRFWDGRFIYLILEELGGNAGTLLPVFERYLINGKSLETVSTKVPAAKDWPWWELSEKLLDALESPSASVDSLMHWLEEERLDVYTAWPESILKLKVSHYVRHARSRDNLRKTLLDDLMLEQG